MNNIACTSYNVTGNGLKDACPDCSAAFVDLSGVERKFRAALGLLGLRQ